MKRLLAYAALSASLLLSLSGGGTPAQAISLGGVCSRLYQTLSRRPVPPLTAAQARGPDAALIATHAVPAAERSARKIENLDDLLVAFTQGLKPDLTNADQRGAFEIYRRMRFGNPETNLNSNTLDQIAQNLKKHPELEKEPLRNFRIEAQARVYPVTRDLAEYLDSQVRSAGQVRANLFQVEANSGYWKKVFQFEPGKALSKDEIKAQWATFLRSRLPEELRQKLLDNTKSAQERATLLFQLLKIEREKLHELGKDLRPISQALVDLVHTIGYHDPVVAQMFKSNDGIERLNAFRKILDERDRFAMALGFPDHFDQVMNEIGKPAGVLIPSGFPSASGLTDRLAKLEQAVLAGAQTLNNSTSRKTVRHLSLVESPFRSCLGGSDCSSRTYLTRALDPNYHYFTLTDETGTSSGQITIVLGEAKLGRQAVKMAFVDKVQNVPNSELPVMLEAMRRSVAEKGYILAVPDAIGDHNGLSNEDITRAFVQRSIGKDPAQPLLNFKPHPHSYNFPNAYSRAELKLPAHAVAPLKLPPDMELAPAELVSPWRTGELDMNKLVEASQNLKNSPQLEDRLRYIPSMKALQNADLKPDPEFKSVVSNWILDRNTPFALRKQAVLFTCAEDSKPLYPFLKNFSQNEQLQLIQNILDSPRYRGWILHANDRADYLISMRENKKGRELLMNAFFPRESAHLGASINHYLDLPELPNAAKREVLDLAILGLDTQILDKIVIAEKKAAVNGDVHGFHGLALLDSFSEVKEVVNQQGAIWLKAPRGSFEEGRAIQIAKKATSVAIEKLEQSKNESFAALLKFVPKSEGRPIGSPETKLYVRTVAQLTAYLSEALKKEGTISQAASWKEEIKFAKAILSAYEKSSDAEIRAVLKKGSELTFSRAVENYTQSLKKMTVSGEASSAMFIKDAIEFRTLIQNSPRSFEPVYLKLRALAIEAAKMTLSGEIQVRSKEELRELLQQYSRHNRPPQPDLKEFWDDAKARIEEELRR